MARSLGTPRVAGSLPKVTPTAGRESPLLWRHCGSQTIETCPEYTEPSHDNRPLQGQGPVGQCLTCSLYASRRLCRFWSAICWLQQKSYQHHQLFEDKDFHGIISRKPGSLDRDGYRKSPLRSGGRPRLSEPCCLLGQAPALMLLSTTVWQIASAATPLCCWVGCPTAAATSIAPTQTA
jgi:hypothetical protein